MKNDISAMQTELRDALHLQAENLSKNRDGSRSAEQYDMALRLLEAGAMYAFGHMEEIKRNSRNKFVRKYRMMLMRAEMSEIAHKVERRNGVNDIARLLAELFGKTNPPKEADTESAPEAESDGIPRRKPYRTVS